MWIPETERYPGYMTMFAWHKWMSSSLCIVISLTLFSHQINGRQTLWQMCRPNLFLSCHHDSLQLHHFTGWKLLKNIFLFRGVVEGWSAWICLVFNSHVLRWKKKALVVFCIYYCFFSEVNATIIFFKCIHDLDIYC